MRSLVLAQLKMKQQQLGLNPTQGAGDVVQQVTDPMTSCVIHL